MKTFDCDVYNYPSPKNSMSKSTTVFVTYCSAKKNHQSNLIPDYDYMLVSGDVAKCSQKIEKQLKSLKMEQIIFFMRPLSENKNVKPYLESIQLACRKNE